MTQWLDSRIKCPNSNRFDKYFVVFKTNDILFLGFASWMPDDGYKTGRWINTECTNGNKIDGEVLYWQEHPDKPQLT